LKINSHGRAYAVIALIAIFIVFSNNLGSVQAQEPTAFSPADTFAIPGTNGAINFAVSGNYMSAALENNSWIFTDLRLNGSQSLKNLEISAENSNITVQYYRKSNANVTLQSERLRYSSQGVGQQTIKINSGVQTDGHDWNIGVQGNNYVPKGKIWKITDGAIQIKGQTGNINVVHYLYMDNLTDPNAPLYQTHSAVLGVLVLVAITVGVASVIKVRSNRLDEQAKKELT
jgi:hypothetical protein